MLVLMCVCSHGRVIVVCMLCRISFIDYFNIFFVLLVIRVLLCAYLMISCLQHKNIADDCKSGPM